MNWGVEPRKFFCKLHKRQKGFTFEMHNFSESYCKREIYVVELK